MTLVSVRSQLVRAAALAAVLAATIAPAAASDEAVTQGCLRYTTGDSGEVSELPLRHTDVVAHVSGTVAEVQVTQVFANPLSDRLEAVYVFPLPDRAAVDDLSIRVGMRLLRGEIHRREEARQIYEQARAEGRLTGLLDQERPNIFTQRVANILPGEEIEVVIHYVEDLHFDHGTWRFAFPMVVGPRYIPGAATGRTGSGWSPDTDRVPDASRITPPVLKPGERSGHDIALRVELDPGFRIADLGSSSHLVSIDRDGRSKAAIELSSRDAIPNKNFVLTWSTAGAAVEATSVAHKVGELGYLTLILQPPAEPVDDQVVPREVVFVIDSSGSMSGEPMAACKQLVRKALRGLRDADTFRLIRFAGSASQLDSEPLPPTRGNLERALSFIDNMRGGGGTEMLTGVRAALDAPKDPYRLRMVLFLTDGYIGNEEDILRRVGESLGDARIFSLGVGSSVNRYLLDRLAEMGRGTAGYLKPGESPDELVARFYQRISVPVFTQLELDWGGLEVVDVEPAQLPDLFAAQPLLVHARYRDGGRGTVSLSGWAGSRRVEISTRVRLPEREEANQAQSRLWARARIARLEMDRLKGANAAEIDESITVLALDHRLMSRFTSFVVVDRSEVREDGELVTVDQPVPMPEGVSYEGVFGENDVRQERVRHMAPVASKMVAPQSSGGGRGRLRSSALQPTAPVLSLVRVPIPDPSPHDPEPFADRLEQGAVPGIPEAPVAGIEVKEEAPAPVEVVPAPIDSETDEVPEVRPEIVPADHSAAYADQAGPRPRPRIAVSEPAPATSPGASAGTWALRLVILTLLALSGILLARHQLLRPAG